MLRAALAALTVLAAGARAQADSGECLPVEGVGCWYAPENAPSELPLLVYLRGHHASYGPDVPPSRSLASSRQAFMTYELGRLARDKGMAVLVTYRSGVGVSPAQLAALAVEAKRTFSRTILAAHSGGYVGLGRTLDAGTTASRVIMLDDFYGAGSDGLARKLQKLVSSGASCAGYHTPHNARNYAAGYKPAVECAVDALKSDAEHGSGVVRCLGGYLEGRACL